MVIQEIENIYNIEINDYVEAYKSKFNLETNPYAIDVINHYKDIKDMFTLTLDSIMNKLNTLLSYVNTHSEENLKLSEIIHLVIQETEDTYNIEINDYVEAYKSEFNLDTNPYAIDVINHYKDVKDMFTLTLDSIMNKLNLSENTKSASKNIFDILAEEINNTSTDKAS